MTLLLVLFAAFLFVVCDRDDIVCYRYDISACVVCRIYVFFCDRDDIACYIYDISTCVFCCIYVLFVTQMPCPVWVSGPKPVIIVE